MTMPQPIDGDDLLSPAQAAARFGVTTSTVRRWATSGKLRWVKAANGHRLFSASDIARLTAGGTRPRTPTLGD